MPRELKLSSCCISREIERVVACVSLLVGSVKLKGKVEGGFLQDLNFVSELGIAIAVLSIKALLVSNMTMLLRPETRSTMANGPLATQVIEGFVKYYQSSAWW